MTTPSGRIACWHRGHGVADDFEKFKFIYNKETGREFTGDWIYMIYGIFLDLLDYLLWYFMETLANCGD